MKHPLRESARGRECQVRIFGTCNGNPATTVLAHKNGGGMSMKNNDLFGAFSCSDCHNEIDFRTRSSYSVKELQVFHYEAIFRTQQIWLDEGLIHGA